MSSNLELFISSIHETQVLELTFNSKEKGVITRKVLPMDYGPWRRHSSSEDRYHFMDINSTSGSHPLSITPDQVVTLKQLEEKFSPDNLVKWKTNWHIARNWGVHS